MNGEKIIDVQVWREHLELTRPYTIAFSHFDSVEIVFVKLVSEAGHIGLGAGSPAEAITGENPDRCFEALNVNLAAAIGQQSISGIYGLMRRLDEAFADNPAARAAADMAIYDLFTQHLGVALVDYLGRCHHKLPTSITIGIKSIEESLEEAEEYLQRGFRILKIKTGNNVDKDIELVAKLREATGGKALIRVDANQGYQAEDFIRFQQATAKLGLEFTEQPLPANAIQEMAALPGELREAAAADESLFSPAHALLLAGPQRPFGIFNIKLMKCGGIHPALQIANIAHLAAIDLMWGCMDESIISISAALHAAFACPATRYLDLDGSLDLARDIVSGGFAIKDGFMTIVEGPGLGVKALKH